MTKKAWSWGLVAATAVAILGLHFGCRPSQKPTDTPVIIGVILPLTGSLSTYGKWAQNAIELAKDDLNRQKKGTEQPFELIIEDSGSSPKDAVSAFKKLVSTQRVPVIIGFIGSSEALACAPVANETKTVLFSSAAASPDLTKAGDYVFRNRVSGSLEVHALARFAREKLGMSNEAIVYINNDYGKSYQELFSEEFSRLGGKIVLAEGFDQGATDFRANIDKLSRLVALDGVYLPTHTKEGATFLKQARELGLRTKFLASNAIISPDLYTIAGDAAEGLIYSEQAYDPNASDEATKKFDEAYSERFGIHSEMFAANAYDALKIVAIAIRNGGYTSDGIKGQLYQVRNYPGASGNTTFDENGDVLKPIAIKQIRDRSSVTLAK